MLLLGRDASSPLFLQIKEAEASVLEPFLGKSAFSPHGQRVVEGQQLTQAASDIMLGWLPMIDADGVERDFYVRQLWDSKGSATIAIPSPKTMARYAELCARSLAKSHARSGDAIAISCYLGNSDALDRALSTFAEVYADQNELDYKALEAPSARRSAAAVSAAVYGISRAEASASRRAAPGSVQSAQLSPGVAGFEYARCESARPRW